MNFYRKHWFDIGIYIATGIGIGMTVFMPFFRKKPSRAQVLSASNFVALILHQFEEYRLPGYFPGQFNAGIFKSETPENYPINTQLAMIINTALGYPFYILPVIFPKKVWLGLGPVLFGFGQALGHGIVFPRLARARYSPGFLACLFLHLPIGIAYIRQIRREQPVTRADWLKGGIYTIGFAAGGLAAPQQLFKDKESPYRFTEQQMGPYIHGEKREEGSVTVSRVP